MMRQSLFACRDPEFMMLRRTLTLFIAVFAIDTAAGTEAPVVTKRAPNAVHPSLPGVPHKGHRYLATITPPSHRPPVVAVEEPGALFAPFAGVLHYIPLIDKPLLPGSSTISGYYGGPASYEYQGPYYGDSPVSYWNRLPYACGVYGYC
jgi:hypothetical protein